MEILGEFDSEYMETFIHQCYNNPNCAGDVVLRPQFTPEELEVCEMTIRWDHAIVSTLFTMVWTRAGNGGPRSFLNDGEGPN